MVLGEVAGLEFTAEYTIHAAGRANQNALRNLVSKAHLAQLRQLPRPYGRALEYQAATSASASARAWT
jgi:hypothetical protein